MSASKTQLRLEQGERQALSPGRARLSWAEGSQKVRARGDHTASHTCRAHRAVQPPAPASALTAGNREKGQQNHPSRKAKGSRRAKVAGFAIPILS